MTTRTLQIDDAGFTRVVYADAPIPAELVGLSEDVIASVPWASPLWAEDGQARVGVAAWFAEMDGRVIVFDPLQAADAFLRADRDTEAAIQDDVAQRCRDAGFAPERVDTVLLSHIDNLGMVARREQDGSWRPFFPNARVLMSSAELAHLKTGMAAGAEVDPGTAMVLEAYAALLDQNLIDTYEDGEAITPHLIADVSAGHGPGHAVLHYRDDSGAIRLSFIGHLAITPLHLITGECAALNEDPPRAWAVLQALLAEGAIDARTFIGPLWPSPGHGRWLGDQLATDA